MVSMVMAQVVGINTGSNEPMLKLSGFSKSFGNKALFQNVYMDFYQNRIYYIYGENGIGKTTLFRCILGQEKFEGEIYKADSNQFCIFDDTPFFSNLTGLDNIIFFTKNMKIKHQIENLDVQYLNNELLCKSKVATYSLGERKMLALLLARLLNSKILLLDEVLNGLDQSNRVVLFKTIEFLKKQGSLIIMSGHEKLYLDICDEKLWVKNKTMEVIPDKKVWGLFANVKEGDLFVE